jgi:hypothetical protein
MSGPSERWGHPGDCLIFRGDCKTANSYGGPTVKTYKLSRGRATEIELSTEDQVHIEVEGGSGFDNEQGEWRLLQQEAEMRPDVGDTHRLAAANVERVEEPLERGVAPLIAIATRGLAQEDMIVPEE